MNGTLRTTITEHAEKKKARDLSIYTEYQELMKEPGAMSTAVTDYLMKKYEIYARSTVWSICQRVKKDLKNQSEPC